MVIQNAIQTSDVVDTLTTTTDNTATVVYSYSPPSGTVGKLVIDLVGKDGSLNAFAGEYQIGCKNNSGTAAVVGSLTTVSSFIDTALNTVVVSADASGSNIRLKVTGLVATTISWQALGRVLMN